MGCDMVVALGRATVDGSTLFGQNISRPVGDHLVLCRTPGREFAPGEWVQTQFVQLPQARQNYSVVGCRSPRCWGYCHGLNDQGVAVGCAGFRTKLRGRQPGLTGTDLVRLVLERSRHARQAVDLLSDLLERHGQGLPSSADENDADHAFLIADGTEAFVVETAVKHWVCQEILEVRAVSNVSTIHQDWDRIAPGLGGHAIAQGWWPADGTKLDFAEALSDNPNGEASALRRWGRATLLLEQQNGHIDAGFLRRLLSDHDEGTRVEIYPRAPRQVPRSLCQHASDRSAGTGASLITHLARGAARLPLLQCAFGPPCLSLYFPVFVDGELPQAFAENSLEAVVPGMGWRLQSLAAQLPTDPRRAALLRDRLSRLQADFEQETEEFAVEGAALKQQGDMIRLRHSATEFMERSLEQFETVLADVIPRLASPPPRLHSVGLDR